jgi:flagellar hook assembly protein FlgD
MATEKDLEWAKENMPIGRKVMVRDTKVMAKVMTEPRVLTSQVTQETRVCVWITNHNGWFPIRELSKAA